MFVFNFNYYSDKYTGLFHLFILSQSVKMKYTKKIHQILTMTVYKQDIEISLQLFIFEFSQ